MNRIQQAQDRRPAAVQGAELNRNGIVLAALIAGLTAIITSIIGYFAVTAKADQTPSIEIGTSSANDVGNSETRKEAGNSVEAEVATPKKPPQVLIKDGAAAPVEVASSEALHRSARLERGVEGPVPTGQQSVAASNGSVAIGSMNAGGDVTIDINNEPK